MTYLFFRLGAREAARVTADVPRHARGMFWRPSLAQPTPPGASGLVYRAWWAMHLAHGFANRDYGQFLIHDQGVLVHRSGVYPRWLRFPFMATADLQIGDTWTDPGVRGRGLASAAIAQIVALLRAPGRDFWYVVSDDNRASIRVIEKAGFTLAGHGARVPRLGIGALAAYRLAPAVPATSPAPSHDSY